MTLNLKLIIGFSLTALFSFSSLSHAQYSTSYLHYTQNPAVINPSWNLLDSSPSLHALARTKWTQIDGAPRGYELTGHVPIPAIGSAAGLSLSFDHFSIEKYVDMSTFFAQSVQLSNNGEYLSASLSLGLLRYEALYSQIDPEDPVFQDDVLENQVTIGFGVMLYNPNRFYLGFSAPNVGISSSKYYHSTQSYFFKGAYLIRLDDAFKLKPSVLTSFNGDEPIIFNASISLYIQEAIGIGLAYGTSKTLGAHAIIYANNRLSIRYNHLLSTEAFGGLNRNNAHEIGISYRFGLNPVKRFL